MGKAQPALPQSSGIPGIVAYHRDQSKLPDAFAVSIIHPMARECCKPKTGASAQGGEPGMEIRPAAPSRSTFAGLLGLIARQAAIVGHRFAIAQPRLDHPSIGGWTRCGPRCGWLGEREHSGPTGRGRRLDRRDMGRRWRCGVNLYNGRGLGRGNSLGSRSLRRGGGGHGRCGNGRGGEDQSADQCCIAKLGHRQIPYWEGMPVHRRGLVTGTMHRPCPYCQCDPAGGWPRRYNFVICADCRDR